MKQHRELTAEEQARIAAFLNRRGVSDRRLNFRVYKLLLVALGAFLVSVFAGWSAEAYFNS